MRKLKQIIDWKRFSRGMLFRLKERYKIERKFGEAKQGHGLGRCRYVGMLGFEVQAFMTASMLNLKRMVKLLTGVGFKTQAASAT